MATKNKITISVTTARRTQTIYWTSVGQEGEVNLSQTTGQLSGIPLSDMSSSDAYWSSILTLVLPEIPA
jgi:hypothetical protein